MLNLIRDCSRVIVLGAGASCSYSESPTGLRPPLAKEIISAYKKLDISENRLVLIGDIVNYVRDNRGIAPIDFYSNWEEDLEKFFTEIDEKVTELAIKLKNGLELTEEESIEYKSIIRVYDQLIFLLTSIFNEIQNGPLSATYSLLADELNNEDIILTFNWDTILDKVLFYKNLFSPYNGYYIKPESVFDDEWINPEDYKNKDSRIFYIKLHGSTNWLVPYHSPDFKTGQQFSLSKYGMNKLYVFINSTREYVTYNNRYWGPYNPFSYCYYPPNLPLSADEEPGQLLVRITSAFNLPDHGKIVYDATDVLSMPLIVPPVKNKQYGVYGEIFSALWALAKESLENCKQLYIIGYSFPKTDIVAKEMFQKALENNTSIEKIIIINPNPINIKEIFLNEFKINNLKIEIRPEKFKGTLK